MGSNIISSFINFRKEFPSLAGSQTTDARINALKQYFSSGGVISVGKTATGWPKLIYPSSKKLEDQIKEVEELKNIFLKKKQDWSEKHFNAKVYFIKNEALKLAEPVYWKHVGKMLFNRDYKEDAKIVKLPASLIADGRWKPMIKTFVNDIEYRKQLVETVQHSIVYEKNREVATYAKELNDFREDISEKKLGEIQKKLDGLDTQIKTLQTIMKWAKE